MNSIDNILDNTTRQAAQRARDLAGGSVRAWCAHRSAYDAATVNIDVYLSGTSGLVHEHREYSNGDMHGTTTLLPWSRLKSVEETQTGRNGKETATGATIRFKGRPAITFPQEGAKGMSAPERELVRSCFLPPTT